MKSLFLIFCLFTFFLVGCNSNKNSNKGIESTVNDSISQENTETETVKQTEINYLISNKSVGDFKIGDEIPNSSINANYKIKKVIESRMTEEGISERIIYKVTESEDMVLNFVPGYNTEGEDTQNIGEILVFSEKYKTKKGIGVNATIEEFIATYPDYNMWYTYVSDMYVIETTALNIQFILDNKDFIGPLDISQDLIPITKEDFKSEAKIVKIRMYEI